MLADATKAFWGDIDEPHRLFLIGVALGAGQVAWLTVVILFVACTIGFGVAGLIQFLMLTLVPAAVGTYYLATHEEHLGWDEHGGIYRDACMNRKYRLFRRGNRMRIEVRKGYRREW